MKAISLCAHLSSRWDCLVRYRHLIIIIDISLQKLTVVLFWLQSLVLVDKRDNLFR